MGNILELIKTQLTPTNANRYKRVFNYLAGKNQLDYIENGSTTQLASFTHNALGAIDVKGSESYYWAIGSKLAAYKRTGVHELYLYDSSGNRVKKFTQKGTTTETTVYIDGMFEHRSHSTQGEQNVIHITDGDSRIVRLRIGTKYAEDFSETVLYNLEDHLGNSSLTVSENKTTLSSEEYSPFGESTFGSYQKKRYRYVGKEKDESGLYYYGARYYMAWSCRFVSTDPLRTQYDFFTPYQYAGNKPINSVDIDGLEGDNDGGSQVRQAVVDSIASETINFIESNTDSNGFIPNSAIQDFVNSNLSHIINGGTFSIRDGSISVMPSGLYNTIENAAILYSRETKSAGLNIDDEKFTASLALLNEGITKALGGGKENFDALLDPLKDGKAADNPFDQVRGHILHSGLDFGTDLRTKVYAPLDGTVIRRDVQGSNVGKGYGNQLVIDHGVVGNGEYRLYTLYGHLHKDNPGPAVGSQVKAGDYIALTGGKENTAGAGNSTYPHLHYETVVVPVGEVSKAVAPWGLTNSFYHYATPSSPNAGYRRDPAKAIQMIK